ncbi:chromate transporter [Clostridium sp. 'deep sea']|uniref:chromate transporter n=1 Tax=Clostridium sp. 'deep sea' TaxID=2779445 RepID=UPI0018967C70|nr:chromate transporter [Clostridium sp. 'deep sea']QOR33721.1 chromate transporter [Clostridium sp. 'deep sea']
MLQTLWNIFVAMLRVGTLGFGGGQASIPLLEIEAVQTYQWMTAQEFGDLYAMGNCLPGPIATKMAASIGFEQAGVLGAVVGLLGMILPSTIAIVLMISFFFKFKDQPQVQGLLKGIRPIVIVLLILMTYKMGIKSMGTPVSFIIAGVAFVALHFLKIHPAFVILSGMLFGVFFLAK